MGRRQTEWRKKLKEEIQWHKPTKTSGRHQHIDVNLLQKHRLNPHPSVSESVDRARRFGPRAWWQSKATSRRAKQRQSRWRCAGSSSWISGGGGGRKESSGGKGKWVESRTSSRCPSAGTGKMEPLRGRVLGGLWSLISDLSAEGLWVVGGLAGGALWPRRRRRTRAPPILGPFWWDGVVRKVGKFRGSEEWKDWEREREWKWRA